MLSLSLNFKLNDVLPIAFDTTLQVTGEVTGKTSYVNAAMIASQLNKDITNALQAGVELPKWAVDEKGELIVQRPEMFLGEKWTFTPIGDNRATFQQGNEQWTLSKYPESEVFLPLAKLTIGDLVNHVNEVMTRRDNENEWWILDRSEVGRTEYSLYNWRVCHFATDEIHSFATDAMKDQQREVLQRIMHEQIDPGNAKTLPPIDDDALHLNDVLHGYLAHK